MLDRDVPASLGCFLTPMIRGGAVHGDDRTDSHKRTHTAVAVDEVGRRLALLRPWMGAVVVMLG